MLIKQAVGWLSSVSNALDVYSQSHANNRTGSKVPAVIDTHFAFKPFTSMAWAFPSDDTDTGLENESYRCMF